MMMNPRLHKFWALILVAAVLNALVGLTIFLPSFKGEGVIMMVGIMILFGAVLVAIHTFALGRHNDMVSGILAIALRLLTGGLLLFHPLDTNITFTTLLAMYFGMDGALIVGEAMRMKRLRNGEYPYFFVLGITSVLFSALIWLFMKGASYTTISLLIAITFWLRGIILLRLALQLKKLQTAPPSAAVKQGTQPVFTN